MLLGIDFLFNSRYEMYGQPGGRAQSAMAADVLRPDGAQSPAEPVPALEFIEYANGETIW